MGSQMRLNNSTLFIALYLLFLSLLSSCAGTKITPEEKLWLGGGSAQSDIIVGKKISLPPVEENEVRPGHILVITSLQDSKLSGSFRVDIEGTIKLPYNKSFNVMGESLDAVKVILQNAYKSLYRDQYFQIDVRLQKNELYVDVTGLIQKPGKTLIKPNSTIDEVLSLSGGPRVTNSPPQFLAISINQQTQYVNLQSYYFTGKLDLDYKWRGGETIAFLSDIGTAGPQPTQMIRVLGEVKSPGQYPFATNADIYHYLSIAGGPTTYTDTERYELIRQVGNEKKTKLLTLNDFAKNVNLKEGDIVIVHSNLPTGTERRLQIAASLASIISTLIIFIVAL
jgi:protein involved in polysaccharide export with SLBB domain